MNKIIIISVIFGILVLAAAFYFNSSSYYDLGFKVPIKSVDAFSEKTNGLPFIMCSISDNKCIKVIPIK